jgi:hypothetical protein
MEALVVILVCTVFALGVYEASMFVTDVVKGAIEWVATRVRR